MLSLSPKFAETASSSSGFGAFNINLKGFIFQLITFVLVLLIFKRWIIPPLLKTIDARRAAVEKGLQDAKAAEEKLASASEEAQEMLRATRAQADKSLAEVGAQAKEVLAKAEQTAETQAQRIIDEANERLGQERAKLQDQLKDELSDLVVLTTEKVLDHKLNEREDRRLIERAMREMVK